MRQNNLVYVATRLYCGIIYTNNLVMHTPSYELRVNTELSLQNMAINKLFFTIIQWRSKPANKEISLNLQSITITIYSKNISIPKWL